jgi:epoxyqueuosine reductase
MKGFGKFKEFKLMGIDTRIIDAALKNGASLAGIASVKALRKSPSHLLYTKMGTYSGIGTVKTDQTTKKLFNWPDSARSILVIGLSHPQSQTELDWWDGSGGTPGNRLLINIMKRTRHHIENDLQVGTLKLHYYVERGGVFLKDAAVLAGLGCIGKNNMLVTPAYGPKIRLRGLFLDLEIAPTGPIDFNPCADCKVYCRKICPENAMDKKISHLESISNSLGLPARDGTYDRDICNIQMEKNVNKRGKKSSDKYEPIKFCRKCELICPVGNKHL